MKTTTTNASFVAKRVTLTGRVQGVGMRPAVIRLAQRLQLTGYVGNTNDGVEIHIEGPVEAVEQFFAYLNDEVPGSAELDAVKQYAIEPRGYAEFSMEPASDGEAANTLSARVPSDVVVCQRCRYELADATNRRFQYPFSSCTDCGPRYSILERMPFERAATSMVAFPLCSQCQFEHDSPSDRRFHAQTNACPDCGPQYWACDADGAVAARGPQAIQFVAAVLLDGGTVALRGLGGYQLLADAGNQSAVDRLRQRKGRAGKPLAVMMGSLAEAQRFVHLNAREQEILSAEAGPIVVADTLPNAPVAPAVSFDTASMGILLPTTPLHQLIVNQVARPLVCTSGNLEGEPLDYDQSEAHDRLGGIADAWLEHDRPIRRPIDDSVVRVIADRQVTIRLARGFAPLPLDLSSEIPVIALGGHQKNSIALHNGAQAVLCPHIGDQDTLAAHHRFVDQVEQLVELYGLRDYELVGDLHPDFFTTRWAQQQPMRFTQVQHHHAHIAAGMLEHGWIDRQVLGVAFDGTGYGSDGTIWGGEFLLCSATDFQRVGHLRPFSLPGGERAVREPWRIATTLVRDAVGNAEAEKLRFRSGDVKVLLSVLNKPKLSPVTSSVGRLFDGVAALILGIEQCEYEGQAAILLESRCDRSALGQYEFPILPGAPQILDWRPLVRQVIAERIEGVPPATMAMRFHRSLAMVTAEVCSRYATLPVVFGGGVFQNRVLVELLADQWNDDRLVGFPGLIPPGDGGLAAGQLAIAAARIRQRSTPSCV